MKQIKDKVKCERAIEKLELEKEFDTQELYRIVFAPKYRRNISFLSLVH